MNSNTAKFLCNTQAEYDAQLEKVKNFKNFKGMVMLSNNEAMFFQGGGKPHPSFLAHAKNNNAQLGKKANAVGRLRDKLKAKQMAQLVKLLSDSK